MVALYVLLYFAFVGRLCFSKISFKSLKLGFRWLFLSAVFSVLVVKAGVGVTLYLRTLTEPCVTHLLLLMPIKHGLLYLLLSKSPLSHLECVSSLKA